MIFVTGTDTAIGKTIVSSWLCIHSGFSYFKPIQTGIIEEYDRKTVETYAPSSKTFLESYAYQSPVSPHLAAIEENHPIFLSQIVLPTQSHLIVEGAGGVLVPINPHQLMIDLIQHLSLPVILVASTRLGTINHTLLSLEALRHRSIRILGVILNGADHEGTAKAIMEYGRINILAHFPVLEEISYDTLSAIFPSQDLKKIFKENTHVFGSKR